MAKNSMTTVKIGIDNQVAVQKLEELRAKVNTLSESLIKLNEKLKDPSTWGPTDTKNTIEAKITETSKKLAKATRDYEHVVTRVAGIDDMLANISGASYNTLTRLRTTLTNTLKNRKRETEDEIKAYEETAERLQKVRDEIARRDVDMKGSSVTQKAEAVLAMPSDYSTAEIKDAIKTMELLRNQTQVNTTEWHQFNNAIKQGQEFLDKWNDRLSFTAAGKRQANLPTISDQALAEQKKYWQEMIAGAEQGSAAIVTYKQFLSEVTAEEQKRIQLSAQQTIADVELGNWDKTIAESKEAVKQLQQYRDTLKDTDKVGLEQVDKAIADLNARIKGAQEGVLSMADALAKVNDLENFDGTIEDLEKLKKRLEEIRDTEITPGTNDSAEEYRKVNDAIKNVEKALNEAQSEAIDLDKILANPKDAPYKDLQRAAQVLKEKLDGLSESSNEFTQTSRDLREVNRQLERMNETTRAQENIFVKTAKRFLVYTSVSSLFYKAFEKGKEAFAKNTELTDSFADIQKTTGLASESVRELSKSIDSIDTRTAQAQLHELAAVAGQLGIKSQTDILGFVRASNMISVSLNELGGEGTSSLMKIATLTGEASIGTEKALLSIGSAINELTANSAATAGPIVDLMNRMGGIAAQAGLTSAQLAGIGASANALGQSVEITGTAMNKFITTLMSNSDKIAYSLNMDAKALRSMLNEGRTMEAIVAVFERLNSMGGLGNIAGVMGDLGSEGARMNQVLSALASNVEFLKSQVELSTDAYSQATSIQQEYNVKNENALAIFQRIGNILHEQIVNSSFTQGLTWIARSMLTIVQALTGGGVAAKSFAAAMTALTAAVIANKIAWVQHMNTLKLSVVVSNIENATTAIFASIKALFTHQGALRAWRIAVVSVQRSWVRFTNFLKANWVTALVAAFAALAGWIIKSITYVSELTRASARFHREVEEEKLAVDSLFASLKRTNTELNNRSRIISEINNKYGSYLGYMLSEHDSAEKLAAAHKLINAEIEKRMALNLQSTLQGTAANEYGEKLEEETTDISKAVKGEGLYSMSVWKGLVNAGEVNAIISSAINEAVSAAVVPDKSGRFNILGDINTDEILKSIKQQMQEKFGSEEIEKALNITQGIGGTLFNAIRGNIEDLLEARVKYMEDVLESEQMAGAEMARITKASVNASVENLQTIEDEFEKLKDVKVDNTWTEKQQVDHYAKMLDNAQDYVDAATKVLREIPESERSINNDTLNERIEFYKEQAKVYAPLAKMDYWGKNQDVRDWKEFADIIENIDTASANSLAAAFKKLKEESAKIPSEVGKFYEMFEGTGLQTKLKLDSPDDIAKTVHNWAEQIREKLKTKYGRNTELGFIFDSGSDKSAKQKAREEYRAALSALDAYYKEREALIREQGAKEGALPTTVERNVDKLKEQWEKDKQELLKMLLGDASTFNPFANEGYMGVLTQNVFFGKNRNTDYLKNLAIQLSQFGIALEDGMRNTLSTSLVNTSKLVEEEVEKIRKALLQDDFTEQVAQQYMESLDTLGLLFGVYETELTDTTAEMGRQRLEAMRKYADESYNLTAEELQTKMAQSGQFAEWMKNRSIESYEVLLGELRKFHDDQEEADLKAAERRKKILENSAEGRALTQKNAANISAEEEDVEMWDRFKGMDLVTDDTVDRAQIDVYQAKIAASQAWIEQIEAQMAAEKAQLAQEMTNVQTQISLMKMRGEDTTAMEAQFSAMQSQYRSLTNQQDLMALQHKEEIADAEKEITDRRIAMQQRTVGEVQKYTDALTQFAYDAAYAEEDADATVEEARNNLIKSLLTSLKDWAQIKLTELTMNALFGQARVQQEAQETGSEMTLDALKAEGKVATATVAATAEQTITKGLVGLAVGAAIGAALNALLGAALGKLNKKKAEVESIAGTSGKLATGMLTYAEGNYPVLGNDGNVYNAKYEGRGMKTGVYGGGAHFGIFSEKQPEAIIDGKTTQKLMLNYPEIWKSIVTLSRVGRIERGMGVRTFATGNIQEIAATAATADAAASAAQNEATLAMMNDVRALMAANMALMNKLATEGVKAGINMYGDGGMYKSMEKAGKFAKRRGY